jgi:hypothetical protein
MAAAGGDDSTVVSVSGRPFKIGPRYVDPKFIGEGESASALSMCFFPLSLSPALSLFPMHTLSLSLCLSLFLSHL